MRYIDADKLKEQINDNCKYAQATNDYQRGCNAVCDWCVKIIKNIPTEDVVPRAEVEALEEERDKYKKYYFRHEYDEWEAEIKQEVAMVIFDELDTNLNNLIKYYKEKRRYVTEVEYNEFEQRFCDIKIRTFEERLLKNTELKKKYIGE